MRKIEKDQQQQEVAFQHEARHRHRARARAPPQYRRSDSPHRVDIDVDVLVPSTSSNPRSSNLYRSPSRGAYREERDISPSPNPRNLLPRVLV